MVQLPENCCNRAYLPIEKMIAIDWIQGSWKPKAISHPKSKMV
jgi:hypothetical protein